MCRDSDFNFVERKLYVLYNEKEGEIEIRKIKG